MKIILIFGIISLFGVSHIFSQVQPIHRVPCDHLIYKVDVHLINKYSGTLYYPNIMLVDYVLNYVNNIFDQACIKFVRCKVDSIADYNYYKVQDEVSGGKPSVEVPNLVNMTYHHNVINLYYVGDYQYSTYNGICSMDTAHPYIFSNIFENLPIKEASLISYTQLFLNYFGLKDPAYMSDTMELVNGSNGTVAADSIWDTSADPYYKLIINDYVLDTIIPAGTYFYKYLKDANGQYYDPMIYNIMSNYSTIKCHDLTREQNIYIINNAKKCRYSKWH